MRGLFNFTLEMHLSLWFIFLLLVGPLPVGGGYTKEGGWVVRSKVV